MNRTILVTLFIIFHFLNVFGQSKQIEKLKQMKLRDTASNDFVPSRQEHKMADEDLNIRTEQNDVQKLDEEPKNTFVLGNDNFLLNGKPFQIISGELHYSRIPRPYWRHRLQMAKAMGFNTIATYVMWNFHEKQKGVFDFESEERNLNAFINLAKEEGLYVILRPGPYACAEWEFGGYPWWILQDTSIKIRTVNKKFLKLTENYFNALYKSIGHQQFTKGGPILMVQVENEYGSFGKDLNFMKANRDILRQVGFDVPLFSADGDWLFQNAAVIGVLPGANGETNPTKLKAMVNKFNANAGPYFTPEWYPGWLDHWGEPKQKVDENKAAKELDTLLMNNISVNIYMFHGGTNFGYWNGANYSKEHPIQPDLTSYDYDAPLSESGVPTTKYYKLREVIKNYLPNKKYIADPPPLNPVISISFIELKQGYNILDKLPNPIFGANPKTFEDLDQGFGYVLYQSKVAGDGKMKKLKVSGIRDFATVYLNGKFMGTLDRRIGLDSLQIEFPIGQNKLELLVENMGRINYGKNFTDGYKGIIGDVLIDNQPIKSWLHFRFPMENAIAQNGKLAKKQPCVISGTFNLKKIGDTFLDMRGWNKGSVWVNGHHIGKYWNIGPQQTLYLPGCWLNKGKNEIQIFEQIYDGQTQISTIKTPILDQLNFDGDK